MYVAILVNNNMLELQTTNDIFGEFLQKNMLIDF